MQLLIDLSIQVLIIFDWLIDWFVCTCIDWFIDYLDWLIDLSIDWLIDWLIDVDLLNDLSIYQFIHSYPWIPKWYHEQFGRNSICDCERMISQERHTRKEGMGSWDGLGLKGWTWLVYWSYGLSQGSTRVKDKSGSVWYLAMQSYHNQNVYS